MKSHSIKTSLFTAASAAGLAIALLSSSAVHATTIISSSGATAILDEDSKARGAYFPNGSVGFTKGAFPATLNSRVPVNVGSYNDGDIYLRYIGVRFADSGADTQVVVKLMEMDQSTGAVTQKAIFDSNSYNPTSPGLTSSFVWQYYGCGLYMSPYNTYWYEVTQTKNVASNAAKAVFFDVKTQMSPAGCAAAQVAPQADPHAAM